MKTMVAAVAAGFIAGSLTTAANAKPSWGQDPTVTEQVNHADLDLSSAAGQKRLKDRISFAAYRLCLVDSPATPSPSTADPVCFHKAMNEGVAQMERVVAAAEGHRAFASAAPSRK